MYLFSVYYIYSEITYSLYCNPGHEPTTGETIGPRGEFTTIILLSRHSIKLLLNI